MNTIKAHLDVCNAATGKFAAAGESSTPVVRGRTPVRAPRAVGGAGLQTVNVTQRSEIADACVALLRIYCSSKA